MVDLIYCCNNNQLWLTINYVSYDRIIRDLMNFRSLYWIQLYMWAVGWIDDIAICINGSQKLLGLVYLSMDIE